MLKGSLFCAVVEEADLTFRSACINKMKSQITTQNEKWDFFHNCRENSVVLRGVAL